MVPLQERKRNQFVDGVCHAVRAAVLAVVCALVVFLSGCATTSDGIATPADVADRIEKQTGYRTREALAEPGVPSGVSLDDGLTEDEAVAIALWNNPGFQQSVADLGIARAELVQAGLLRNPVFTLLLPWGPKQLEATAKLPIEAIWQRPQRVAAARVAADAVAERLVATGLNLVADSRLAVVGLVSAQARVQLAADTAEIGRRIAELSRRRLSAGDISQLEADTFETEASRAAEEARRVTIEVDLARNSLRSSDSAISSVLSW
jgi:outer membrane protein, heavy metal efflux system